MTQAEEIFDSIARDLSGRPGIEQNRRGSLIVPGGVRGAVRAMTSHGRIVVKLDPERTAALVIDAVGEHYKDQRNAWLELRADLEPDQIRALIAEALQP
ncbi:hypothetical protein [Brevibacterium sp.]|uniref:hypothetical protein n=1 Tax=Brevibacterium sp. TaxID=1701 RepID=UPI002811BC44|nr:hypothetical protein [Brevibacterium sp.]